MPQLVARGLTITIDRPMIMAVINATPDSFSDAGKYSTVEARMECTREVLAQGADILDFGGQSAITGVPEISSTLSNMTDRQNYRSTKNFSRSRNQKDYSDYID